jgi:DNA-binding CsgD family transcriptional regulator
MNSLCDDSFCDGTLCAYAARPGAAAGAAPLLRTVAVRAAAGWCLTGSIRHLSVVLRACPGCLHAALRSLDLNELVKWLAAILPRLLPQGTPRRVMLPIDRGTPSSDLRRLAHEGCMSADICWSADADENSSALSGQECDTCLQHDPVNGTMTQAPPCLQGPRHGLLRFLDHLSACTALCTVKGRILYVNPALRVFLRSMANPQELVRRVSATAIQLRTEPAAENAHQGCCTATLRGTRVGEGDQTTCGVLGAIVVEPHGGSALLPHKLNSLTQQLTARESEVVVLLARGMSTKAIARELAISWHTTRGHVERTMRKLGVGSRSQIAALLMSDTSATSSPAVVRLRKPPAGETSSNKRAG